MKELIIHADEVSYKVTEETDVAEEISDDEEEGSFEDILFVRIAVEKEDEKDIDGVADKAVEDLLEILEKIGIEKVLLYPYVHLLLGSKPASPDKCIELLKTMESKLDEKGIWVRRAPFGFYKKFNVSAKGHPLAELSREITPEGEAVEEIEEECDREKLLKQISKSKVDRRELEENDHRILAQKMNLFSFNDSAPGMVFWHHNGLIVYRQLIDYWRELHRDAGYREISTPLILDEKLWKVSGHWEKFRDNMFLTQYEDRGMAVKPMNCPGGILIYKSQSRSYRDLPLRFGEMGKVHRKELSGVLSGLFRVNYFTQDDAHIYCTEEQLDSEIEGIIELVEKIYEKFDLSFHHIELATRPENRMGDEELWDLAEETLEEVLKNRGMDYEVNEGEGTFYGPKIDFHVEDSLGRSWQCGTIQLDFMMPERFELEYIGEDDEPHRPIMLHRAIYGSVERFLGVLLEHTKGNLPVWLAPVQAKVLSLADRNVPAAKEVVERLEENGIRVNSDFESSTLSKKVRKAEIERVPYIIVIGDDEEENGTLSVRRRDGEEEREVDPDDFIKDIQRKIENRD